MSYSLLLASFLLLATAASAQYDPNLAWQAIHYSKAAYCDGSALQSWTCPVCPFFGAMQAVRVFSSTYDTQAFAGYDAQSNRIVVAFRGSHNIQNWIADLSFTKVAYPPCNGNCSVHHGFYSAYTDISKTLLPYVTQLYIQYGAPILVTGHSLGGAMSIFCAIDLMLTLKPETLKLYNFGEPRVGDKHFPAFAASVLPEGVQYRITHAKDPVPHVPPESFGFLHTPREVWYDNDGNTSFKVCNGSTSAEDKTCADSIIPIHISEHLLYLGVPTECTLP